MSLIKTPEEIKLMRQAGKILAKTLNQTIQYVKPGVSTLRLDQIAEDIILKAGAEPAFKNYSEGDSIYPATICASINEQIVHAIPRSERIMKLGDIIGIDCGVKYKGYYSDMAISVPVGKISSDAKKILDVTEKSLVAGIAVAKDGDHLGDISWAIQSLVEKNNLTIIKQLCGHGIGRDLHEEPEILNYGRPGTGLKLKAGMVLAIEPMVSAGDWRIKSNCDDWAIVTADGSLSAHFEHTILITESGAEILTKE